MKEFLLKLLGVVSNKRFMYLVDVNERLRFDLDKIRSEFKQHREDMATVTKSLYGEIERLGIQINKTKNTFVIERDEGKKAF